MIYIKINENKCNTWLLLQYNVIQIFMVIYYLLRSIEESVVSCPF